MTVLIIPQIHLDGHGELDIPSKARFDAVVDYIHTQEPTRTRTKIILPSGIRYLNDRGFLLTTAMIGAVYLAKNINKEARYDLVVNKIHGTGTNKMSELLFCCRHMKEREPFTIALFKQEEDTFIPLIQECLKTYTALYADFPWNMSPSQMLI